MACAFAKYIHIMRQTVIWPFLFFSFVKEYNGTYIVRDSIQTIQYFHYMVHYFENTESPEYYYTHFVLFTVLVTKLNNNR